MSNELLLIITLIVEYSAVVLMYKYLGRDGLYLWTVLATITANIEVLILVKAFGMEMTLGNVLFATTFWSLISLVRYMEKKMRTKRYT